MATKAPADSAQLERKQATVTEIQTRLREADAAMLAEYRGLTVTQLAELRAELRGADTDFKIFKNTLARRAVEDAGLDDLLPLLEGPTAIAFVRGDAVLAAKALVRYSGDFDDFVVKGGLLGERLMSGDDVKSLSTVPPREELLARLAGGFKAPMARAAGAFGGLQRKVAYAVQAYITQRVEAGESAEAPSAQAAEEPTEPAVETTAGDAEASGVQASGADDAAPVSEEPVSEEPVSEEPPEEPSET